MLPSKSEQSRKQHRKRQRPLAKGMMGAFVESVSTVCVVKSWQMKCVPSARLEEQNGHLAQVEVDKMLGLVSHIAAEVPPDDAVPGRVVLLVKLLWRTTNVLQVFTHVKNWCSTWYDSEQGQGSGRNTSFRMFGIPATSTLWLSLASSIVNLYWAREEFRGWSRAGVHSSPWLSKRKPEMIRARCQSAACVQTAQFL